MKCSDLDQDISAYFDNELSPAVKKKLEEHIQSCPRCQKELELIRKVRQHIKMLPEEKLPELNTQRLRTEINKQIPDFRERSQASKKINLTVLVAAIIGVIFIAFIGFPIYSLWLKGANFRTTTTPELSTPKQPLEETGQFRSDESLTAEQDEKILTLKPVVTISNDKIDPENPFQKYLEEKKSTQFKNEFRLMESENVQPRIIEEMTNKIKGLNENTTRFIRCLNISSKDFPNQWLPVIADKVNYKSKPAWLIIYITSEKVQYDEFDQRYFYIIRIDDFEIVAEGKDEI